MADANGWLNDRALADSSGDTPVLFVSCLVQAQARAQVQVQVQFPVSSLQSPNSRFQVPGSRVQVPGSRSWFGLETKADVSRNRDAGAGKPTAEANKTAAGDAGAGVQGCCRRRRRRQPGPVSTYIITCSRPCLWVGTACAASEETSKCQPSLSQRGPSPPYAVPFCHRTCRTLPTAQCPLPNAHCPLQVPRDVAVMGTAEYEPQVHTVFVSF